MSGKKIIILFLGLLLPILIFLFLRMFGKNEFDVPVPHEDGVIDKPADCNLAYGQPYILDDTVIEKFTEQQNEHLLLVHFGEPIKKLTTLLAENAEVIYVNEGEVDFASESHKQFIQRCILLMPEKVDVVLVDNQKRIRGYYDLDDRDEIDRLDAELVILLKKY
ncbi:MAG TPA: hypothetical protein VD927_08450 [Chryseosolibacter sp.]|nr:hypothetical protein [Chryseosolibacter sp.]